MPRSASCSLVLPPAPAILAEGHLPNNKEENIAGNTWREVEEKVDTLRIGFWKSVRSEKAKSQSQNQY